MYKVLSTLFLMVMSWTLSAQFVVSGQVINENGEALIGANVTLKNTYSGDETKDDGYFTITNIATGNYTLVVSYLGYKDMEKAIIVEEKDLFLNVTLEKSTIISEEIIVYSTRANENTPTTFTNLSKADIEKNNYGQDVPYLLELTPSVVTYSDAGNGFGYTGLRIRGTDATRINVTINGVPLNDAESQGVFWVNLPDFASSTESAQIQRGVGTSTNGGSSFGGTINLFSSKLNDQPYAELNNAGGSFGTLKNTLKLGSGLIGGKFALDGRISRIVSDGYVDRASSNLFSYYLSGGFYAKNQSLRLNVFHGAEVTYQAWNGVTLDEMQTLGRTYNSAGTDKPGEPYDNQVDDYQQTHYQLVYVNQLNDNLNFNTTAYYTKGAGFYEEYKGGASTDSYGISPSLSTDLIRQRWLDNDLFGAVFSLNYFSTDKKIAMTLGGGWNNYVGRHFGDVISTDSALTTTLPHRYYENEADKTDFNLYGKMNYQLTSQLNGFVDLQYRRVNYGFLGVDEDGSNLVQDAVLDFINPKVGLTFEINPSSRLYGFFGVANKEPNRNDYVDNPPTNQPKHEELYDLELGYHQQFRNAAFSVNYYYMYYNNQLVSTGALNDVGAYVRTNVDQSFRMGLEVAAKISLGSQFEWSANATFSNNKVVRFTEYVDDFDADFNWIGQQAIEHENTNLAFSPNVIIGSEITYKAFANNQQLKQNNQLNFSLLSKFVGQQYVDNSNGFLLDEYMTNDIRASYALTFKGEQKSRIFKAITASFLVRNIFNVLYEPNAWTYRYNFDGNLAQSTGFFPQAGTSFLASLNFKF